MTEEGTKPQGDDQGKIDVQKLSYKATQLEKERDAAMGQVADLQKQLAQFEVDKAQLEQRIAEVQATSEKPGTEGGQPSVSDEELQTLRSKASALEGALSSILRKQLEPVLGAAKVEAKSLQDLQLLAEALEGVELGSGERFDRGGATVGDKGWPEGGFDKILRGVESSKK